MTDQPMSQAEIDALLAGMSGGAVEPSAPPPPPVANPPSGGLVVDQGELDALLASLIGDSDVVPEPNGPIDQNELDSLLSHLETGANSGPLPAQPAQATGQPGTPLGQDDIDHILASLDSVPGGSLERSGVDPAQEAVALGQDAAPPAVAQDPLGQDDIASLLAHLDAAPASVSKTQSPAVAGAAAALPEGKLGQDDIDSLLNSLNAQPETPGASKIGLPAAPGTLSRGTLALSTEDLSALVTKHGAPTSGEPADGMIDQGDIDALVKQLGVATGTVEIPGEKPSMTEELAKHDAAIDQLLAGGKQPAASAMTMDAIDFKGMADKSPGASGTPGLMGPSYTVNVPVLTPPELRGARWLLAAAVLLLAICAGTLVVVAGAVRTLGTELARERAANLEPGDDYGTDFAAAVARLASPDEDQVATGVLFLQRLRKRSPSHDGEIGLALARHFRSHGAWKEAGREYAAVVDDPKAVSDDPRVFVEYADCLRQLDDRDGSRRQLYTLLADETRWTGKQLSSQTVERNRHTLVEAHLLLARLLDGAPAPTLATAETEHEAAPAGEHPTAHPAAHATPDEHPAAEGHH